MIEIRRFCWYKLTAFLFFFSVFPIISNIFIERLIKMLGRFGNNSGSRHCSDPLVHNSTSTRNDGKCYQRNAFDHWASPEIIFIRLFQARPEIMKRTLTGPLVGKKRGLINMETNVLIETCMRVTRNDKSRESNECKIDI